MISNQLVVELGEGTDGGRSFISTCMEVAHSNTVWLGYN